MPQRKKDPKAIKAEVQETLHSLDKVAKVKVNPFFYTRLKQQLDALEIMGQKSSPAEMWRKIEWFLVPALVAAGVLLGVFIGYEASPDHRSQNLEILASTYGLDTPDVSSYLLVKNE